MTDLHLLAVISANGVVGFGYDLDLCGNTPYGLTYHSTQEWIACLTTGQSARINKQARGGFYFDSAYLNRTGYVVGDPALFSQYLPTATHLHVAFVSQSYDGPILDEWKQGPIGFGVLLTKLGFDLLPESIKHDHDATFIDFVRKSDKLEIAPSNDQTQVMELEKACENYRSQLADKCEQIAHMKLDVSSIKNTFRDLQSDHDRIIDEFAAKKLVILNQSMGCIERAEVAEEKVAKLKKKVKKLKKKLKD